MRTQQMIFKAAAATALVAAITLGSPDRVLAGDETNTTTGAVSTPAAWQASGVSEVMKMFKGGISAEIIVSYINNSPLSYVLTADNIISLQQQGVPQQILTAMLNRAGELHRQGGMAAAGPANVPSQAPAPKYYSYAPDDQANFNAALQARAEAAYAPTYVAAPAYPAYDPYYYDPYYYPWYGFGGPVVFDIGVGRFGRFGHGFDHGGFGGHVGGFGGHIGGFGGHVGGFGGHGGGGHR